MQRRWTVLAATTLAGGLVLGAAAPSQAASKEATTVTLTSISHVATTANPGATIVSGDSVELQGTASKNLIGKTVTVQTKQGKVWVPYVGQAKVSPAKTYTITTRATGIGKQSYRVRFSGSKALKAATGGRSAVIWQWLPLAPRRIVDEQEYFGGNAPHLESQVSVAGVTYSQVLAGTALGQKSGWSELNLGYHCQRFTSIVGLGSDSPSGATGTFTVSFDGNEAASKTVGLGGSDTFDLDASGFYRIRLGVSNTAPSSNNFPTTTTAWPLARVLCNAQP